MVSEVQRERVLSEAVLTGFRDIDDLVPNAAESELVAKSFVKCYGWLGHLGDRERRAETDHRVYRERNHDGTVFSGSDVDIRRKDRKRLEEDPMAKLEDSILLFDKHRDATIIASLGYISAIGHLLQHRRWSARWIDVLRGDEGKKTSIKLDEIVIYWER